MVEQQRRRQSQTRTAPPSRLRSSTAINESGAQLGDRQRSIQHRCSRPAHAHHRAHRRQPPRLLQQLFAARAPAALKLREPRILNVAEAAEVSDTRRKRRRIRTSQQRRQRLSPERRREQFARDRSTRIATSWAAGRAPARASSSCQPFRGRQRDGLPCRASQQTLQIRLREMRRQSPLRSAQ